MLRRRCVILILLETVLQALLISAIVIIFALVTKKTLEALLLGTVSTYIIMYGLDFPSKWAEAFFKAAGDADNQWVTKLLQ